MAEFYKLKHLTGRRLKVFLAVAEMVVPPDEDSPGGGTMATAGVADWAMDRMEPGLRKQFLLLLMAVEFLGVFFGARTFTRLGDAARYRELSWLESAPVGALRTGFMALKVYACMGYYTREDVWETIDYEGPLLPDRPFPDQTIRDLCQGRLEVSE